MIVVDALTTNFYTCNGASASGQMPAMYRFLYSDPADAPTHNYTFLWSPSTYISNPNSASAYITLPGIPPPSGSGPAQPPLNYTYTFTVTNANYGCSASNTQTASVINPRKIGVPTDMRKGFDTLCGIVQQHMQTNVLQGGVYIFVNKKRNQIKLLTWEGDGLAIYYKRLEKGVYEFPSITPNSAYATKHFCLIG